MDGSRRQFLAVTVGAAATAVAGCLGGGEEATAFRDHEASNDIDGQPTLGSLDRPGVVVGFEDPSCVACRRFEQQTFPRLKDELIESGDVGFVYRTLDVVLPWGEPAAQVLASTHAADAETFWGLKSFFYEHHDLFTAENVFEEAEPYLRESPVDAETVLADARAGAHEDLIAANRAAAKAAGVSGTPTFYLFRDGELRTEVSGPQDYEVFAGALGFE
jgi:protein-disulfide isomerase